MITQYKIFASKLDEDRRELQMNDISTIMKELQNNLANKLRKDIESYQ